MIRDLMLADDMRDGKRDEDYRENDVCRCTAEQCHCCWSIGKLQNHNSKQIWPIFNDKTRQKLHLNSLN